MRHAKLDHNLAGAIVPDQEHASAYAWEHLDGVRLALELSLVGRPASSFLLGDSNIHEGAEPI